MTALGDLLEGIDDLDGGATVYAAHPWTCESEAVVAIDAED